MQTFVFYWLVLPFCLSYFLFPAYVYFQPSIRCWHFIIKLSRSDLQGSLSDAVTWKCRQLRVSYSKIFTFIHIFGQILATLQENKWKPIFQTNPGWWVISFHLHRSRWYFWSTYIYIYRYYSYKSTIQVAAASRLALSKRFGKIAGKLRVERRRVSLQEKGLRDRIQWQGWGFYGNQPAGWSPKEKWFRWNRIPSKVPLISSIQV